MLPGLIRIEEVTDKADQLRGIDKILYFSNGSIETVDVKIRRTAYTQNGEPDILLEVESNSESKRKGWLYTAECSYIAYFVEPLGRVYLLPVMALRMAWAKHGGIWQRDYKTVKARNHFYYTTGICVPAGVLLKAIMGQLSRKYDSS